MSWNKGKKHEEPEAAPAADSLPAPEPAKTHLDELIDRLDGPGDMSWSARQTLLVALRNEVARLRKR